MDSLYDFFAWNISLFGEWWYFAIMIVGFSFHWWIEYMLNDGGGSARDVLDGFREDVSWAIPGSRKRRGEYIRRLIMDCGENAIGSMGGYSYEEIRRDNLYEKVGAIMLPGPFWFWSRFFGWVFWPVAGATLLIVVVFVWVLHGALTFSLGAERTMELYDKVSDFIVRTYKKLIPR